MSEVIDVPDDSPPRSPDVECPFGEEGSSEKTMESRKRGVDEQEQDAPSVEVPAKKTKLAEDDGNEDGSGEEEEGDEEEEEQEDEEDKEEEEK